MSTAVGNNMFLNPEYGRPSSSTTTQYLEGLLKEYAKQVLDWLPPVIQGGMGVGISGWRLARASAQYSPHMLGTVSGVVLHEIMLDVLRNNKSDSREIKRVLTEADFPFPKIATKILDKYCNNPGKKAPIMKITPSDELIELLVVSAYIYIKLAKEGHTNKINLNLLEKTAMFNLYTLYGAMLAGLDILTVGAGIPDQIKKALLDFSEGRPAEYIIPVRNRTTPHTIHFDPRPIFGDNIPNVHMPKFIGIASSVAASRLVRAAGADGVYVELHEAAGHNAPPRGGQVEYGPKDNPNIPQILALGLPVILGGGYGRPGKLREALSMGASSMQVGSILQGAKEAGGDPEIKANMLLRNIWDGTYRVARDRLASPTDFPFNVFHPDNEQPSATKRACTMRGLATLVADLSGEIDFICPAESIPRFKEKGGDEKETEGRRCLCRELSRTAGIENGASPIITFCTTDIRTTIKNLLKGPNGSYTLADAMDEILRDEITEKK